MKNLVRTLLLLLIGLFTFTANAQQNLTLYNLEVVPQRMYANPALFPSYSKVNIGLPVLSSKYLNISNSGFKYSDLVRHRADDSLYIDYDNMLSKLKDNNYLSVGFQVDLFSFGIAIEKNYFSFNVTEKANIRFRYPKGFMKFIGKGNGGMLGEEVKFNFGLDATAYTEYGLGYSRKITDELTVGGKLKYLNGQGNIRTQTADISLTTNPTDYALVAKANMKINTAIDTTFKFATKNRGMGVDLGGTYKLDKFNFSASVIDLGFIRWKANPKTYQSSNPDASFVFQGLNMNDMIASDSSKNNVNAVADSLQEMLKIDTITSAYTTPLNTQIYLGANYNITEKINTGVLFYSHFFDKSIHPGVALSFNQRIGRWFNYSVSYNIYNRSYNNVGLGLAFNLGPVQWYVVSDNVLGPLFPQKAKNIHIQWGLNLTFGRAGKNDDIPKTTTEEEKKAEEEKKKAEEKKESEKETDKTKESDKDKNAAPTSTDKTKTLKPTKKDLDGDGIANKVDLCPNDAGVAEFSGCPDKDKDHVQDKDDMCPADSGSVTLKGCPDKDGDGIIDMTDSCPDIAGLPVFNGCPDKDGDKVIDKLDECPDAAGLPELKGCPDKDGDGTPDKTDACPEKQGPASNKGCPETKLNLIDSTGASIKSAVIGTDGSFTFADSISKGSNTRFKLQGDKTDAISEVTVMINGVAQKAVKDSTSGLFKFVIASVPTAEVAVQLEAKEAEVLKKAFNNLEFATAKDIIKKESYPSLDELASLMAQKTNWKLKISGHTDNQGDPVTNLKLSEKRAEAVKTYLVSKGIAANRFKVEWFGATKPVADNKTEEGRQQNRRVEMLIFE